MTIRSARGETTRSCARATEPIALGLVIPLQGPAGMFGPSCEACARLAVEELNLGSGLLGRELELVVIDGGRPPEQVASEVGGLVSSGGVDAVTGWHISSTRRAITSSIRGRVPYVYAPLYEGGEEAANVFLTGETPAVQLQPALGWLSREKGVRRWCIVGDDYVWPRQSARAARDYIRGSGALICDEFFLPLGTQEFSPAVDRVERSRADGVLMLLVGQDAVLFNRAFAAAGMDQCCVRFSPLMEENMLLASGAESTRNLYAAAGYFDALPTSSNLDFHRLYVDRFGPSAPTLNSLGESCYEGVTLFAQLVSQAASLDPAQLCGAAGAVGYDGPRGSVHLAGRHLRQPIHLAEAAGLDFEVVTRL